jgi:DNA-binding SARP family transcriptional activator
VVADRWAWLGVLGPVEVRVGGRPVDVGGPRPRAALAALAASAGHVATEDELIDAVWGESPPPSVRNGLQSHVSNLRRALGGTAAIERVGNGYRLDPTAVELDVTRFEELVAIARETAEAGDPGGAIAGYDRALVLWRGRPLPELADVAAFQPVIVRLEELLAGVQEARVEALLEAGHHTAAVADLEAMVAEQPLRERRRELQVLALYRSGQQAAALRAVQAARTTLVDELGLDPGPELRRLESMVLNQDPALDWRPARGAATSPPPGLEPPPAASPRLVGRHRELERFRRAVHGACDAVRPGGGVVLVAGEPGIGKTRLAEEAAEEAAAEGMAVAWGRCSDIDGAPPLWPWAEILRALHSHLGSAGAADPAVVAELASIVPELGAGAAAGATEQDALTARFRLFDAVESTLVAIGRVRPLLLVLDDLHWADAASLRLLAFLAPRTRSAPLLVVGTYRPEAATPGSALGAAVGELGRHLVDHHRLRGFDAGEVARYASEHLDVRLDEAASARLRDRTDGNPYFVAEMLRLVGGHVDAADGSTEIPLTVRDVLRRRVASLGDDAAALLEAASVLGKEAPVDLLAAVLGRSVGEVLTALAPPCSAGVVAVTGAGRLQFAHALVREVLYDELPPARRAHLHADAGRALLRRRAAEPGRHRAEIAHHLYHGALAGTAAEAVDQLELAAREAARGRAYEDEVVLRERAVELAEGGGATPERCHELLADLALALDRIGDAAGSRAVARRAVDVGEELGEPSRTAAVLTGVTHANLWYRQAHGTVDATLTELLGRLLAATPDADRATRARLLATSAEARYYEADPATGAMALEAVDLAEATGDPLLLADVLFEALLALWRPGNLELAARLGRRLADVAVAARLSPEVAIAGRTLTRCFDLALGRPVDQRLEPDLAAVTALRLPFLHAQLLWHDAGLALARGDLAAARRRNAEARALIERATSYGGSAAALMDWALALEVGDGAAAAAAVHGRADAPLAATSRLVAMALAADDPEGARVALDAAPRVLPDDWMWLIASCAEAEAAVAGLVDAEEVLSRLAPHQGRVSMLGTMFHIGPVDRYTGRLRRSLGDLDGAADDLRRAIDVAHRVDAPVWRARSEVDLAEVLLAAGGPDQLVAELLESAGRTAAERRSATVAAMVERLGRH